MHFLYYRCILPSSSVIKCESVHFHSRVNRWNRLMNKGLRAHATLVVHPSIFLLVCHTQLKSREHQQRPVLFLHPYQHTVCQIHSRTCEKELSRGESTASADEHDGAEICGLVCCPTCIVSHRCGDDPTDLRCGPTHSPVAAVLRSVPLVPVERPCSVAACGKTVLCSSDTAVLCSNDTVVLCSIANGVLPGSDTDVVVCRAAAHFEKQLAVSDFWAT